MGDPRANFRPGTFLVAGGSGGVGAAIAQALAAQGCDLALTYHSNRAKAEAVAAQAVALGVKATVHALEASDPEAVGAVVAEVTRHAPLAGLIYAAGPLVPQIYLGATTPAQMLSHLQQDAAGFFNLCHHALPHLRQNRAPIVAVQSAAQTRVSPADALSLVPKAAVHALMKSLAKEEGRNGVRANGVALGMIDAGSMTALAELGQIDATYMEVAHRNIPLRSIGRAEDAAEAVLWLASNRSAYVTGELLHVDGGYHL